MMDKPTFTDIVSVGGFKPAYFAVELNVPKVDTIKLLINRVQKFDNIIRLWVVQGIDNPISLDDVHSATALNVVTYDAYGKVDTIIPYKVKSNNQVDFDWDNTATAQAYIYSFEIIG